VLSTAPTLQVDTIQEGNPSGGVDPQPIALRARMLSPGYVIFHQSPAPGSGAPGLSCASCHPDGLTSGATTTVNGVTRRVMPLAGRLANATIVHWEAQSFHDAVSEGTWHTNMGGPSLTTDQEQSLNAFVAQLKAPARPAGDPTQVALGKQLFESSGCSGCHNPATAYTNDSVADVGHGMHKVPSLVGLLYTAPYMSDGCAPTLEARFNDAACGGGAQHGMTQNLSADDQAALITFLKTL
jgi:hypothetical protein